MTPTHARAILLSYGVLNAILYSSLLPLWEGFDEEFHYGYVQYVDTHGSLPLQGHTRLSQEIAASIPLLPMSHVMIRNLHWEGVRSFDQYFALASAARRNLYQQARIIPTGWRLLDGSAYLNNYEVHHAPLAYLLMAIPDRMLASVNLPLRVWILRVAVSLACVLLSFPALLALGSEAGLEPWFTHALIFLIFSCQMFWATVAHVANDWLAVPLAIWLIVCALRWRCDLSLRTSAWLAAALGLGLLSKAYFLVFVPLYLLAVVWMRIKRSLAPAAMGALLGIPLVLAGPWYARNWILYHNLSGRIEETAGVTAAEALHSLVSIPWWKSLPYMARGTFWLGNSTFSDFSILTMDAMLVLLGAALVLNLQHGLRKPEAAFLWTPLALFSCAMIYVAGSNYVYTQGAQIVASPWYMQAVIAPLVCLALLGCQRSGRGGIWLARSTLVLWGYVLAATYVAKLFPLYGGFSGGRSTLREILRWYTQDWARTQDILSTTAMIAAPWLAALMILLLADLAIALFALLPGPAKKGTDYSVPPAEAER